MIKRSLTFGVWAFLGLFLLPFHASASCPVTPPLVDPPSYSCRCDGSTFASIGSETDLGAASSSCSTACSDAGATEKWELLCPDDPIPADQGNVSGDPEEGGKKALEFTKPNLAVPIPGLTFSDPVERDGVVQVPYLAEYISSFYSLMIVITSIGVIISIMVAGLRWMVARGNVGAASQAREQMGKSIVAFLILIGIVSIVNLVDPSLSNLNSINIRSVDVVLYASFDAAEGPDGGSADAARCTQAEQDAKSAQPCPDKYKIGSPTGSSYSCNYHFLRKGPGNSPNSIDYDYQQINALDFAANWDGPLYAPLDGRVSYLRAGNLCGNLISMSVDGQTVFSMCHVKDFTDENGVFKGNREVRKGEVIGHIGGRCADGEVPTDTTMQEKGWCNYTGKVCDDPEIRDPSCQAQPFSQSGRTSGPHVHITWKVPGYTLLSCFSK